MGEFTNVEFADHTFNPWFGCSHAGPGCDGCYAWAMMDLRLHNAKWGPGEPRVRTAASNWKLPRRWNRNAAAFHEEHGRRQRVFCASLADVFDNEVNPQWREDLWALIHETPELDWIIITKRIGNARKMLPADWPHAFKHVMLLATVVNQQEAERDIPKLLETPAYRRGIIAEPMLGAIDLSVRVHIHGLARGESIRLIDMLDLVINGGESDQPAIPDFEPRPMHLAWPRSLRDQCVAAGVNYYFKQWGEYLPVGQTLPGYGKIHGATAVKPGRMKLHYGGTPKQAPKHAFAKQGVEVASMADGGLTFRVGKKSAGRLLDGQEWNEYPERTICQ